VAFWFGFSDQCTFVVAPPSSSGPTTTVLRTPHTSPPQTLVRLWGLQCRTQSVCDWTLVVGFSAARAASMIRLILEFAQLIDRETLEPMLIQNIVPLCMAQYKFMFSTTRVPGKDCDSLQHYSSWESKHFVVFYRGVYYTVQASGDFETSSPLPSAAHLQIVFEAIMATGDAAADADTAKPSNLASLTTMERAYWNRLMVVIFGARSLK
jgi:Choline/Carnitine o-acyltransferase